jgi:hypothetical protein
LLILSRDAERISVRDAQGKEFTVSPRQSGLAWRVCEPRALSVAAGDALRLRAVGHVSLPNGKTRRLANGSTVTACGLDAAGRVKLPDGSILASREFVPEIRAIRAVSSFATPSTWTIETDRGDTTLVLKGEEDIRRLARASLLIADRHGIQYLVRDIAALDRHSRKLLDRFL